MFDPSKIGSVKEVSFPGVQQFFLFSAKKMKTDLTASKYLMALKTEEILIAELETFAFTQVFKRGQNAYGKFLSVDSTSKKDMISIYSS